MWSRLVLYLFIASSLVACGRRTPKSSIQFSLSALDGVPTDYSGYCVFVHASASDSAFPKITNFSSTHPCTSPVPTQWGVLSSVVDPSAKEVAMQIPVGASRRFDILAIKKGQFPDGICTGQFSAAKPVLTGTDLQVAGLAIDNDSVKYLGTGTSDIAASSTTVSMQMLAATAMDAPAYCQAPTIVSPILPMAEIETSSPATYIAGDPVDIFVKFPNSVAVVNAPALNVLVGAVTGSAAYVEQIAADTLKFRYYVPANVSGSLTVTRYLDNTLGSIVDTATNLDVPLQLIANDKNFSDVLVDSQGPTIVSVFTDPITGAFGPGQTFLINVEFSEPVYFQTDPNQSKIYVNTTRGASAADYVSGDGTNIIQYIYTVVAADGDVSHLQMPDPYDPLIADIGTIKDAIGNQFVGSVPPLGNPAALDQTSDIQIIANPPVITGTLTTGLQFSSSTTDSPQLVYSLGGGDSSATIVGYQFAYSQSPSPGGLIESDWTSVQSSTYTFTGLSLTNGIHYYPFVRAVDDASNVSFPIMGAFWLVDTNPPTDVSSISLEPLADDMSSFTAQWLPADDGASSGSGVDHYRYSVGIAPGDDSLFSNITPTANTNVTVSGLILNPDDYYYFNVEAFDKAGNGPGTLATFQIHTWDGGAWFATTSSSAPSVRTRLSQAPFIGSGGPGYFVWGGLDPSTGALDDGAFYNPQTDTWTTVAEDLTFGPSARYQHQTTVLNGQIVVLGGVPASATTGTLDPGSLIWLGTSPSLPVVTDDAYAVDWHKSSSPPGDYIKAWIFNSGVGNALLSLNAATTVWSQDNVGTLPFAQDRSNASTTLFADHKLFTWGGTDGTTVYGNGGIYDLESATWTALPSGQANEPSARADAVAIALDANKIFVWGGHKADGETLGDGAIYDFDNSVWLAVPTAPLEARTQFAAAWTGHRVMIWGGRDLQSTATYDNGAVYWPANGTWSQMSAAPIAARATMAYGSSGSDTNADFELFVWGGDHATTPEDTGAVYHPHFCETSGCP